MNYNISTHAEGISNEDRMYDRLSEHDKNLTLLYILERHKLSKDDDLV